MNFKKVLKMFFADTKADTKHQAIIELVAVSYNIL